MKKQLFSGIAVCFISMAGSAQAQKALECKIEGSVWEIFEKQNVRDDNSPKVKYVTTKLLGEIVLSASEGTPPRPGWLVTTEYPGMGFDFWRFGSTFDKIEFGRMEGNVKLTYTFSRRNSGERGDVVFSTLQNSSFFDPYFQLNLKHPNFCQAFVR